MAEHAVLLTRLYADFNARDLDAVLAVLHPDVDWPNAFEGGRVQGRDGVREYWARQLAQVDPRVEPEGFSEDDEGRTVVRVHQMVRDLAGAVMAEDRVEHVFTFEHGLVVRMDVRASG